MSRRYKPWDWEYPPYPTHPELRADDASLMDEFKNKDKDKKEDKPSKSILTEKKFSVIEFSIWLTLGSVFLGPLVLTWVLKNAQILKATLQQTLQ
jgi:hypothetical protein